MAVAPVVLYANPTVIIKDPPPPSIVITSTSFSFTTDPFGGGFFSFQNESGSDWHSLLLTAEAPAIDGSPTISPGPFVTNTTVSTTPVGSDILYQIRFGPTTTGGIPNGTIFSINLDNSGSDPNGAGDWVSNKTFTADANVPEPASSLLFLAGGLLIAGLFRYRPHTA